ncbi:hypothetical protein [Sorangium sp. So ce176]|uniref:hypothetical protein n=1 Tax=Sorangium sp. So ce176 TaxID=3133286 RepID=UPI003F5DB762
MVIKPVVASARRLGCRIAVASAARQRRLTARRCAFACRGFRARGRVSSRRAQRRRRRRVADMRAAAFIYATQAGKSRCLSPCKCALLELKRCDFPVCLFESTRSHLVTQEFSREGRTEYAPFEIFYNPEPFL